MVLIFWLMLLPIDLLLMHCSMLQLHAQRSLFQWTNSVSFMSQPLETHWVAVKGVLRYLKGTISWGLYLHPASMRVSLSLTVFCDADWASDPYDWHSTSGTCVFLDPNLISWWSKKQTVIARSSTEVEYQSLAHATAEITWMQTLLSKLVVQHSTPQVYCDNLSTVFLANNPVLYTCTKNVELDFFVHQKVLAKQLQVLHACSSDQYADILTKALSPHVLQIFYPCSK